MLVRVTGLGDRIEGLRGGEGNEKSLSSLYTSRGAVYRRTKTLAGRR